MINESRFIDTKTNKGHKRLNPNALNDYLNEELANEEKLKIKITHLSSTINKEPTRKDSQYLTAYGRCTFSPTCRVNYIFRVKKKLVINNQIEILIEITNSHDHDTLNTDEIPCKNVKNNHLDTKDQSIESSAVFKNTKKAKTTKRSIRKTCKKAPITSEINSIDTLNEEEFNEIFSKFMENDCSLDQNYALTDFSPTNDKTLDQKVIK